MKLNFSIIIKVPSSFNCFATGVKPSTKQLCGESIVTLKFNKQIKFSSDLNKTSLKNINRKNITNLLKFIPNKSIYEILILNRICNYMILNNKEEEFIDLLFAYNKDISIKEIELCLKIDKTYEFKLLFSKDKKKITKIIKNKQINVTN